MSDESHCSPRAVQVIGRGAATCLLALAVAYGIGGSVIEYSFSSDPLGPRVFPMALAVVLGLLAVWYFFSPGSAEGFPSGVVLARVLAVPVLLVVSVVLFEPAGFAVSIFILTLGSAFIFGAPPGKALIGAAGHATLWWVVFSYLLEVYLPSGTLFGR
ncbi:tripartite tricarboxylate transporter TctB family protein [Mesorhizobium sp. B2-4-15]|uniref:tripartite tricarboxylate transporter TctB family protein n=1 Tax=unclassified Mesorhizobium TaxID=325217 RepID=UPI0011293AA3|nr:MULTISPECIES: tripartite tricarboxylate transporter TctB family protein [unclassified Mesorhizobium]TPK68156.1 tripartite tricarboxylate transporter TctB family protein [Mesorhizobium sp. B2-4-15]TPM17593.1 tripartite tricarboxylate transporter TctB family protein [Mesorhizobium sp. B2-3-5]